MLTRIKIRHFKLFEEVELDLGQHVVLVGPNNSGKTSLLQAIALWEIGLKKWLTNKSREIRTTKRLNRITINRNDLTALPVPSSNQLWHQLQMRSIEKTKANKVKTNRLLIEITVHGWIGRAALNFTMQIQSQFTAGSYAQGSKRLSQSQNKQAR